MKKGVLLVNLGSPKEPTKESVKQYLHEFLLDERVITLPSWKRHILVKGIIVPLRLKAVTKSYTQIYKNNTFPIISYGKILQNNLQEILGEQWSVKLAMRYGGLPIEQALEELRGCKSITILPLFPQYASATTGSILQKCFSVLSRWKTIPDITCISSFPDLQGMIDLFVEKIKHTPPFDHLLFSFHGLPVKHLFQSDTTGSCRTEGCCLEKKQCYSAQCIATAQAIIAQLPGISWSIAFQSRLGKEPWMQPYTVDELKKLAQNGVKRVAVCTPSFICDCLETTVEIGEEAAHIFIKSGGEKLLLIPSLNEDRRFAQALATVLKGEIFQSSQMNHEALLN